MSAVIEISTPNSTAVIEVSTSTVTKKVVENIAWYTADGTEGNSIVINGILSFKQNGVTVSLDLTGRTVTAVNRGNAFELEPTEDVPGDGQFNWAGETPTLTLAILQPLGAGEKLKITYV